MIDLSPEGAAPLDSSQAVAFHHCRDGVYQDRLTSAGDVRSSRYVSGLFFLFPVSPVGLLLLDNLPVSRKVERHPGTKTQVISYDKNEFLKFH